MPDSGTPEPDVRASDAERDATLDRLSEAAGEGRLTMEEFSQRMEAASSARTRGELARLVADLPPDPGAASRVPLPAPEGAMSHHQYHEARMAQRLEERRIRLEAQMQRRTDRMQRRRDRFSG
jgi:primosomal protein N''